MCDQGKEYEKKNLFYFKYNVQMFTEFASFKYFIIIIVNIIIICLCLW